MQPGINIEKEVQSIIKEGFLDKQSRFLKSWRRYAFLTQSLVRPHAPGPHDLQGPQSLHRAH